MGHTPTNMTSAVLGAGGLMGRAIAANLVRNGVPVRAWNRSRGKAEPLAGLGAHLAGTPGEAAREAEFVITMLADADAVIAAMADGALAAMADDAIWLQLSTIGEAATERCAALARERGVGFFDAPVLGSVRPAELGQLVVLASGPDGLRRRVEPVFDVIGRKTIWLAEAGSGTRLKLVLNGWVVSVVEACAEIIALAQAFGLDPRLFFEAVEGGPLDLPYLRTKGHAMIERQFEPAFRLTLAAKDAALVDQSARRLGLDLPLLAAVSQRLATSAKEHPDKDMSATYLTSAR